MISAVTFSAGRHKKPSLSGDSSLTRMTIRPSRSSLIPSSVLAMGIRRISFGRANDGADLTRRLEQFLNVFTDQIGFQIDFITNPTDAQISVLQSEWNNRHGKAPAAAFIHGQANSVYSN